jgi:hypothetical protein
VWAPSKALARICHGRTGIAVENSRLKRSVTGLGAKIARFATAIMSQPNNAARDPSHSAHTYIGGMVSVTSMK